MSLDYIRGYYNVPAKKGGRVTAYGKPGVITGAIGAHLMIRLDGMKHARPYHPTDEIGYAPAEAPSVTGDIDAKALEAAAKAMERQIDYRFVSQKYDGWESFTDVQRRMFRAAAEAAIRAYLAAAPESINAEMLAALKSILYEDGDKPEVDRIKDRVRAAAIIAIAESEGGA